MFQKTTDLEVIREQPRRFTWGKVVAVDVIGPYTIVCFVPNNAKPEDDFSYHVYVDGKDTSCSAGSLEAALLLAIGLRRLGPNEGRHMASAACRVLGVPSQ